jgi:chromosome segregation ATPase
MWDIVSRVLSNPQTWVTVGGVGGAIIEARRRGLLAKKAAETAQIQAGQAAKKAENASGEIVHIIAKNQELSEENIELRESVKDIRADHAQLNQIVKDYLVENQELKNEIKQARQEATEARQEAAEAKDAARAADERSKELEKRLAESDAKTFELEKKLEKSETDRKRLERENAGFRQQLVALGVSVEKVENAVTEIIEHGNGKMKPLREVGATGELFNKHRTAPTPGEPDNILPIRPTTLNDGDGNGNKEGGNENT